MRDDIFEEDMFEEETNDTTSGLDDDSQHVYELMQKGLAYMDEAVHYIDKIIKINNIFDENITEDEIKNSIRLAKNNDILLASCNI